MPVSMFYQTWLLGVRSNEKVVFSETLCVQSSRTETVFGCFRPQAVICNLSIYLSYYNCCKNVSLRCCYKVLQYHHACGNTFFVMIFVSAICNMFYNIIHLLLLDKALKSEINSEILLNFYFPFAAFFLCLRLSQANHNIL